MQPDDVDVVVSLTGLSVAMLRALWAGMERRRDDQTKTVWFEQMKHEFVGPGGERYARETITALESRGLMDVTGSYPHRRARLSGLGRWYGRAALRLFTNAAAAAAVAMKEE